MKTGVFLGGGGVFFFFTLRRHQQFDALQHVEEELIAAVLDALPTPTNLSRHLTGDLGLLLLGLLGEVDGRMEEDTAEGQGGRKEGETDVSTDYT